MHYNGLAGYLDRPLPNPHFPDLTIDYAKPRACKFCDKPVVFSLNVRVMEAIKQRVARVSVFANSKWSKRQKRGAILGVEFQNALS